MTDILLHCNENSSHTDFAEGLENGTDKATGIDAVIRHYGIDLADTMASGDRGNDISMIRHAGTGVAMGNASEMVKASADIVTSSVDDNGVAEILNRI